MTQEDNDTEQLLRIRGKLQTGWALQGDQNEGSWSDAFYVRRARIDGRWRPTDWAKLVLEMELAQEIAPRDVYVELSANDFLQVTVGRFKKPFSRLRLMSPWDLLIPDRGLLDQRVVDDTKFGGFGARDFGLMFSGEAKGPALWGDPLKISYSAGVFNSLPGKADYHRDMVGRVQLRVFKGLSVALNSTIKLYEQNQALQNALMVGGDLKWETGPWRVQLEGATGKNVASDGQLFGSHGIFSYSLPLNQTLTLTPAVMLEVFDPDINAWADLDLRLAVALNLDINENIRLVASFDKVWEDVQSPQNILPDPFKFQLQTSLRFP